MQEKKSFDRWEIVTACLLSMYASRRPPPKPSAATSNRCIFRRRIVSRKFSFGRNSLGLTARDAPLFAIAQLSLLRVDGGRIFVWIQFYRWGQRPRENDRAG